MSTQDWIVPATVTAVLALYFVYVQIVYRSITKALACTRANERANRAKRWLNDRALLQWAAVKAGRCSWCLGSGLEITRVLDLDDDSDDEPDWDVDKCHVCEGEGVVFGESQERMLELWQQMVDQRMKLDDPLGVSLRARKSET